MSTTGILVSISSHYLTSKALLDPIRHFGFSWSRSQRDQSTSVAGRPQTIIQDWPHVVPKMVTSHHPRVLPSIKGQLHFLQGSIPDPLLRAPFALCFCFDYTVLFKLLFDSHHSLQLQCSSTESNKCSK